MLQYIDKAKFRIFLGIFTSLIGLVACIPQQPGGLELPSSDGSVPWTIPHNELRNDPPRFVIVSDRTGGMRGGVFASAIPLINELNPDFVMSIGDLIDGYTTDSLYLEGQWKEFENIISGLEHPFFRVAGNHDISNSWMAGQWNDRFGQSYYHFWYDDYLFLCLNTDDNGSYGIESEQVDYFKAILATQRKPAWVFVFMHRPLWMYGDQAGYGSIAEALEEYPYTVFSGHHHFYQKSQIQGRDHYVLATTGGGSFLRGAELGEFDHISVVTLNPSDPEMINIALNGDIVADDIVNDDNADLISSLRTSKWIDIDPVWLLGTEQHEAHLQLRASNRAADTISIQVGLADDRLSLQNSKMIILEPGQSINEVLPLRISPGENAHSLSQPKPRLDLVLITKLNGELFEVTHTRDLVMDSIERIPLTMLLPNIDGDLSDWEESWLKDFKQPGYVKEDWDWKGPDDGRFKLGMVESKKFIMIAMEVTDDQLLTDISSPLKVRDHVNFFINSLEDSSLIYEASYFPGIFNQESASWVHDFNIRSTDTSYTLEMSILKEDILLSHQSSDRFRLNVGITDSDRSTNNKPSVLWYRPPWGSDQDYPGSGTVILNDNN